MTRLNKVVKSSALAAGVAAVLLQPAFGAQGPKGANPPALPKAAKAAAGATTTYTACYFKQANGEVTWKWGLQSAENKYDWYSMSGNWITTQYTKVQKFSAAVNADPIQQSCRNSQAYYNVSGSLLAIFAADSNTGANYPILIGSTDLYPQY